MDYIRVVARDRPETPVRENKIKRSPFRRTTYRVTEIDQYTRAESSNTDILNQNCTSITDLLLHLAAVVLRAPPKAVPRKNNLSYWCNTLPL